MSTAVMIARANQLRRNRRFGVFSLLCVAALLAMLATVEAGADSTFVLNDARGQLVTLPSLVISTLPALLVLAVLVLAIAAVQLSRGFGERTVLMVAVVGALLTLGVLIWAAAGGRISLVSLFNLTIRAATPIALGGMCGVLCERAGVINIAIEGQFLAAAFTAAVVASIIATPWAGLIGGMAAGLLVALMLAGLSIRFRADQIVTGVVLIVFATGVTSFLASQVLSRNADALNAPERFSTVEVPLLAEIPLIGPVLFRQSAIGFLMFAVAIVLQFALFRTRWGLRLRSVGEHPRAADTVGIDVLATRYKAVLLGGVVAGIGGAYFTLDGATSFTSEMSAGKGFIALAAMLVGRYSPVGALAAALLFGFADSLATQLGFLATPIPSSLLRTAPYVVTIFVVAGLVGRLRVPAADGQPYVKQ